MKSIQGIMSSITLLVIVLLLGWNIYNFYSEKNNSRVDITEKQSLGLDAEKSNFPQIIRIGYYQSKDLNWDFPVTPDNITLNRNEKIGIWWIGQSARASNMAIMKLSSVDTNQAKIEVVTMDLEKYSYTITEGSTIHIPTFKHYCCSGFPVLNVSLISIDEEQINLGIKASASGWEE